MIHNPLTVRATAVWVRESRDGTVRSRYLSSAAEQRSGHTEPTQQSPVAQHSSHCTTMAEELRQKRSSHSQTMVEEQRREQGATALHKQ